MTQPSDQQEASCLQISIQHNEPDKASSLYASLGLEEHLRFTLWCPDQSLLSLQAIFEWWQYKLCDIFIELVKPVMTQQEGDKAEQDAFRETLWVCLDTGLRSVFVQARGFERDSMDD